MRKIIHLITLTLGVGLVGGCQTYADRPFFDPLNLQVEMQPRMPKVVQVVPSEQSLVLTFPEDEYALSRVDPASVKVRTNIRGIDENEVNLTIKSYLVTLPGCPDFTSRAGRTFDNRPHSNWGCATASNIGLMVDEPRDLLIGRGGTPADAEALVLSTQRYRAGETRSLDVSNSNTAEAFVASGGGGQSQ